MSCALYLQFTCTVRTISLREMSEGSKWGTVEGLPHDYNKELESIRAADSSNHVHKGGDGCFSSSSPNGGGKAFCVGEGRPPGSRVECAKRCVDVDGARMRAAGPAAVAVVAVSVTAAACWLALAGNSLRRAQALVGARIDVSRAAAAQLAQRMEGEGDRWLIPQLARPAAHSSAASLGREQRNEPSVLVLPSRSGGGGLALQEADRQSHAVGFIFLPEDGENKLLQGSSADKKYTQQLPDIPAEIPGQVAAPEYQRKFLPFLPCSVWGGDQVVCTTADGRTTVTVVLDDGTSMPGDTTSGTFAMPGDWLKHPSPDGNCYSSCDFYWCVLGPLSYLV